MPTKVRFGSSSERLRERFGKCEFDDCCMRLAGLPHHALAIRTMSQYKIYCCEHCVYLTSDRILFSSGILMGQA
jgi:hypothetical protein